jgi:hypothetical protein
MGFYWMTCVHIITEKTQVSFCVQTKNQKLESLQKRTKKTQKPNVRVYLYPLFLTVFTLHFKRWPHREMTIISAKSGRALRFKPEFLSNEWLGIITIQAD